MKKIALTLLVLLAVSALSYAKVDKYKIYMEKKGLFGLGGKTALMLDTETGQTWKYNGKVWEPMAKIDEQNTEKPPAEPNLSKEEQEANDLKVKQAEELKTLIAKQEQEISGLRSKLEAQKKDGQKHGIKRSAAKLKPKAGKPKQESQAQPDQEDSENQPPGWLNK